MLMSGGFGRSGGGGRNDENVGAWLLCLLKVGFTAEVAPLSGLGVLSLLAKVSMLLLLAWSWACCSLRLHSTSRSWSALDFVTTRPFLHSVLGRLSIL